MQDIEIIYIDDCSIDKSDELIQNLQKKDKRIILLKNKERKGTFYSRNKGAIFARGEYLQYIDSADLLVGNILEKAYLNAKTNNIDII
jgi:teichuronic acid biosynthesis glycosyltransferase TuaG